MTARTSLRQNIEVLARKVEIYIDWPSNPARNRFSPELGVDPISQTVLGMYNFDCDRYKPDYRTLDTLKSVAVPRPPHRSELAPTLKVDWRSTKHHVVTFHYCFEGLHAGILVARQWAAKTSVAPAERASFMTKVDAVHNAMNEQVERLNAFMTLSMRRIEDIRLRNQPNGFFCHLPLVHETCNLIGYGRG